MAYFLGKNILHDFTVFNFESEASSGWNRWKNFLEETLFEQDNYI